MLREPARHDWRGWIVEAYAERSAVRGTRPELSEGATAERLAELETQLCHALPEPLRDLLAATDGVRESIRQGGEWMEIHTPVWSCDEIARANRALRAEVDHAGSEHICFAHAGWDGILFALRVEGGDGSVEAYYPIDRLWRRVSPSLAEHLRHWEI